MALSSSTPSAIGRWNALRPDDQALAAGPLVDDRGAHGLGQVARRPSTRRRC